MRYLKKYSPTLYHNLEKNGLKERAEALDPVEGSIDYEKMRELLMELKVENIRRHKPNSKQLLNGNISVVMRAIVHSEEGKPSEIKRYLEKYRERYEEDDRSGELKKMVLGKQLEFEFQGSYYSNISHIDDKPSKQEVISYFRRKG